VTLFAQAAAAVLVAVALTRSIQQAGGRGSVQAASAAVAAAVTGFLALGSIWGTDHELAKQRASFAKLGKTVAAVAGAGPAGADNNFAEWLRGELPAGASVGVMPAGTAAADSSNYQWTTFRLLPRTVEPDPNKAKYIVFWGVTPKDHGFNPATMKMVARYDKVHALARWRR
jgi:hypothetical protein